MQCKFKPLKYSHLYALLSETVVLSLSLHYCILVRTFILLVDFQNQQSAMEQSRATETRLNIELMNAKEMSSSEIEQLKVTIIIEIPL